MLCLEKLEAGRHDEVMDLAVLLHDVAKPACAGGVRTAASPSTATASAVLRSRGDLSAAATQPGDGGARRVAGRAPPAPRAGPQMRLAKAQALPRTGAHRAAARADAHRHRPRPVTCPRTTSASSSAPSCSTRKPLEPLLRGKDLHRARPPSGTAFREILPSARSTPSFEGDITTADAARAWLRERYPAPDRGGACVSETVLELTGIRKRFGLGAGSGRRRLPLRARRVHALLGENGAGKSTLMQVVSGLYVPDAGEMRLGGTPVAWRSPEEARRAGIAMVHQHFMLVPTMTIAENVALARGDRASFARCASQPTSRGSHPNGVSRSATPVASSASCRSASSSGSRSEGAGRTDARADPRRADRRAHAGRGARPVRAAARDLAAAGTAIVIVTHKPRRGAVAGGSRHRAAAGARGGVVPRASSTRRRSRL